jgi:hypothetical protein
MFKHSTEQFPAHTSGIDFSWKLVESLRNIKTAFASRVPLSVFILWKFEGIPNNDNLNCHVQADGGLNHLSCTEVEYILKS